jgi:hypothetical protein
LYILWHFLENESLQLLGESYLITQTKNCIIFWYSWLNTNFSPNTTNIHFYFNTNTFFKFIWRQFRKSLEQNPCYFLWSSLQYQSTALSRSSGLYGWRGCPD